MLKIQLSPAALGHHGMLMPETECRNCTANKTTPLCTYSICMCKAHRIIDYGQRMHFLQDVDMFLEMILESWPDKSSLCMCKTGTREGGRRGVLSVTLL